MKVLRSLFMQNIHPTDFDITFTKLETGLYNANVSFNEKNENFNFLCSENNLSVANCLHYLACEDMMQEKVKNLLGDMYSSFSEIYSKQKYLFASMVEILENYINEEVVDEKNLQKEIQDLYSEQNLSKKAQEVLVSSLQIYEIAIEIPGCLPHQRFYYVSDAETKTEEKEILFDAFKEEVKCLFYDDPELNEETGREYNDLISNCRKYFETKPDSVWIDGENGEMAYFDKTSLLDIVSKNSVLPEMGKKSEPSYSPIIS